MSVSGKLVRGIKNVRHLSQHRDWENYRDLVTVLVQKDLKVRYGNKLLGYLWSIANPLASAFVYYFVFSFILRVQIENYAVVVICGLFPWQWIGNSVGAAPNMFISNASIIKKVSFPTALIPLCATLNHLIHFVISLPVIVLFILLFKLPLHWSWIYGIPLLLLIQLVLTYGISLILASINLFFRDLERLTSILMNFIFYFTPVIYTKREIPEQFTKYLVLNPFFYLVSSWRELLMEGTINPEHILVSVTYAMLFLVISYWVYRKLSWKFAEVI